MAEPFFVGIPTLCRHDLLAECLGTLLAGTRQPHLVYVIDNGGGFSYPDGRVRVLSPPENLGVARSWNLLHKLTYPHSLFLSNDDILFAPDTCEIALATPGPFVAICSWACFLQREPCWQAVGEYDEALWPAYFEDNDYHYRMRLCGLDYVVPSGGAVTHRRSSTLQALPEVHRATLARCFEANKAYYLRKWGGLPGQERFRCPFNAPPGEPPRP
jgi:GT2 family glycosyltransferase